MSTLQKTTKRTFVIGDEWLYIKLYCGPKTADELLTQAIKPLTEKLLQEHLIDKWFFIRYSDPKLHLRIRFHFNKTENISVIIQSANNAVKKYIESDLLWKIQVDTYQREIERYGFAGIEQAEELFFHDSEMIVNFLDLIEGDEGEVIRWLFSLRAIDKLLSDFNYSGTEKLKQMEVLKVGFGNEFGMNKMLKLQLDKKFRDNRKLINDIFKNKYGDEDIQPLIDLLNNKTSGINNVVDKLKYMQKNKILDKPLNDLMGSYIHMLMNRLFKSKQRVHEMVAYDLLYRYYKSEIAKKKQLQKQLSNV